MTTEVFTKIHINTSSKEENVSKKAVERAIQLSYDKYCSVGAILEHS